MFKYAKITLPILAAFVFMGLFATSIHAAGPTPKIVVPIEKTFYLTKVAYSAVDAPTACAAGYHFASIWEIWDFSNFAYNTELGTKSDDSGLGPPVILDGWVRSGWFANNYNCYNWTSTMVVDYGLQANIHILQAFNGGHPWQITNFSCQNTFPVWCVSDPVY